MGIITSGKSFAIILVGEIPAGLPPEEAARQLLPMLSMSVPLGTQVRSTVLLPLTCTPAEAMERAMKAVNTPKTHLHRV